MNKKIILLLVLVTAAIFLGGCTETAICGDQICSTGEELTCPIDCGSDLNLTGNELFESESVLLWGGGNDFLTIYKLELMEVLIRGDSNSGLVAKFCLKPNLDFDENIIECVIAEEGQELKDLFSTAILDLARVDKIKLVNSNPSYVVLAEKVVSRLFEDEMIGIKSGYDGNNYSILKFTGNTNRNPYDLYDAEFEITYSDNNFVELIERGVGSIPSSYVNNRVIIKMVGLDVSDGYFVDLITYADVLN